MATYDREMIIRYVEDELPVAERQQFEEALSKDASLAAGVALYKELKGVLQERLPADAGVGALRETLGNMNARYFGDNSAVGGTTSVGVPSSGTTSAVEIPSSAGVSSAGTSGVVRDLPRTGAKRISMTRWVAGMAAAASVILAVVLLWPSRDYLERLGRTEMISTTERGGNADSLLQQAAVYFNQQQFDKALPLLDRAVKEDSSSQLALFYRGVAGWHTGGVENSRKDLEMVYRGGSLLRYEAAFYIALGYAGQKNKAVAKEWLGKIPDGTAVSEKAKELGKKLE